MTLREGRRQAFEAFGIPEDGGDSEAWVDFKLGPVPMPFPNSDARRRAVKLHDLHHVLTGYRMDIIGEFEISAWEIAAGCGGYVVPWYLNLMGVSAGLISAPRRTARAFWRGARARSLYTSLGHDAVIDRSIEDVQRELGIAPSVEPRLRDVATLAGAALAGSVLALVTAAVVLTPVTLVAWVIAYRASQRARASRPA